MLTYFFTVAYLTFNFHSGIQWSIQWCNCSLKFRSCNPHSKGNTQRLNRNKTMPYQNLNACKCYQLGFVVVHKQIVHGPQGSTLRLDLVRWWLTFLVRSPVWPPRFQLITLYIYLFFHFLGSLMKWMNVNCKPRGMMGKIELKQVQYIGVSKEPYHLP